MMKIFSLSRYGGKVLGLILVALFLTTGDMFGLVTKPQAPLLSLTGEQGGYDATLYPDGRLWLPPSREGEDTYVLVPVFIQNNFFTFNGNEYVVPPIYSFRFSMFYDAGAIQAVGFETTHPSYMEDALMLNGTIDEDPPYANGWNIDLDDRQDGNYFKYIDEEAWNDIKDAPGSQVKRGRRLTIDGTSIVPMRHNDKNFTDEWKVLLYVKFKIIGRLRPQDPDITFLSTPMYIAPDEIRYNDLDITKKLVYEGFTHIYKNPQPDYPALPAFAGLAGMNNEGAIDESLFLKEPYRSGSMMVKITDNPPRFNFPPDAEDAYTINKINDGEYELDQTITVNQNNTANPNGVLKIVVENFTERSRLSWINIETNEPWLLTSTNNDGTARRSRNVTYFDNDILGKVDDPMGEATTDDGTFYMNIICDPSKLKLTDPSDPEKAGLYVGYITFKSPVAQYHTIRLKVKFLYIKAPYEPKGANNPEGYPGGIFLTLRNSRGQTGDSKDLVFGTGDRGTIGVDPLYGEFHPTSGLATDAFDARFFLWSETYKDTAALFPNGFGDFSPNTRAPYTSSRDIRNKNEAGTHIYLVKFNANGDQNYPVVLTWDPNQFPVGSRVFLRDTLNGSLFQTIDMRQGTQIGNLRSFTFSDAAITSFIIEYTLPTEILFTDNDQSPIIKKGWNLLSTPVRPVNSLWSTYYPNAINQPFFFSQNQYQSETDLRAGVGYFVKYSDSVDKNFTGTFIKEISTDRNDYIRVFPGDLPDVDDPSTSGGWNAIGACSAPTNVANIKFTQFQTSPVPATSYTLKYGVWRYSTDNGYKEVSQFSPGLGYWIKVNSTGYLKLVTPYNTYQILHKSGTDNMMLDKAEMLASTAKMNINDNAQHSSVLYFTTNTFENTSFELPPAPPAGLFDARFSNNMYLSNTDSSIVKLQGVTYPVMFSMDNANGNYTLTDAISGENLGSINADNNTVVIKHLTKNAVKVEKVVVSGLAVSVYPNPVGTNSTVDFNVIENGNVTLKLYNEVGTEVMTLVNAEYQIGAYTATLTATNLPTGSYILKLTNGSNFQVVKVNVVK
ncbi:MAG: hypothetical protein A2X64_07990 [Ignavibacteria bacterium GWF2_33_9]|nr:MAG: hypothetical protein A2X64_07990 [Ignavibacteria bacterium GWF2_33_9]